MVAVDELALEEGTADSARVQRPSLARSLAATTKSHAWSFKERLQTAAISSQKPIAIEQDWSYFRQWMARAISSNASEGFMGIVIVVNLAQILIETERRCHCEDDTLPECPANFLDIRVISLLCLIIYCIELAARIYVYQRTFFNLPWNVFDFVIVVVSIAGELFGSAVQDTLVIRMVRLMRLARILRLLTIFQELYLMIAAMASTMRTIFWACVMLVAILAICSLVAVQILRPVQVELAKGSVYDNCPRCSRAFDDVTSSMITFFQTLIMGEGISDIFVPLIENDVLAAIFIIGLVAVVFLGFSNLILSVIVDKAQEARCSDATYQAMIHRKMREDAKRELLHLWQQVDTDGSNTLTLEELKHIYITSSTFRNYFKSMDVDIAFLEYAFRIMDPDESGECSFAEFAESVVTLKNIDPAPVASFIKFQVGRLTADVSLMKVQLTDIQAKVTAAANATCLDPSLEGVAEATDSTPQHAGLIPPSSAQGSAFAWKYALASFSGTLPEGIASTQTVTGAAPTAGHEVRDIEVNENEHEDIEPSRSEDLVDLLRSAYDEPVMTPRNNLLGPERRFVDQCQRIEIQLSRLLNSSVKEMREDHRMEIFACCARLLAALSKAMPGILGPPSSCKAAFRRAESKNPPVKDELV